MRFYTNFQVLTATFCQLEIVLSLEESFWEPPLRAHAAWVLNAYLPARTILQIIPPRDLYFLPDPITERFSYGQWQNIMEEF